LLPIASTITSPVLMPMPPRDLNRGSRPSSSVAAWISSAQRIALRSISSPGTARRSHRAAPLRLKPSVRCIISLAATG